jgi:hypothetical protein
VGALEINLSESDMEYFEAPYEPVGESGFELARPAWVGPTAGGLGEPDGYSPPGRDRPPQSTGAIPHGDGAAPYRPHRDASRHRPRLRRTPTASGAGWGGVVLPGEATCKLLGGATVAATAGSPSRRRRGRFGEAGRDLSGIPVICVEPGKYFCSWSYPVNTGQ